MTSTWQESAVDTLLQRYLANMSGLAMHDARFTQQMWPVASNPTDLLTTDDFASKRTVRRGAVAAAVAE